MRAGHGLSNEEVRWLAIEAQGLARPRPKGPIRKRHLESALDAIGQIQLDAINVLERTQFLVPFSRLGPYDTGILHDLTGPGAYLFEYWGHAVSLLPTVRQPLFRWRMEQHGTFGDRASTTARREAFQRDHAGYIDRVFGEVRDRGPLTAGQLTDPRRRSGEWWERRSFGRVTLEYLFMKGALAGWRDPQFERVYDLPERVIPDPVRARPTPPVEEAQRQLLVLAARSLGVATVRDLAGYYRIKPRIAKERVAELVEAGELVQLPVEGWTEPGYAAPAARPRRPTRTTATLLSPFDSLIWDRSPRAPPVRLRLPHRGVHARAEARVRVLRAPAPPRRSARCALRPEGRSQGVGPPRSRFVSRARRRPAHGGRRRVRGARHDATLVAARPRRGRATRQPRHCREPRDRYDFALIASISAGTTLCTSPTMPRSATEKIGASRVLVDRDDVVAVLHAHEVLRRTGDAERDVHLRLHGLAGLTDLERVGHPAGVDDRARRAPRALELLRERFDERRVVLGRADSAAARHDHRRLFELRALLLLDVTLEHLGLGRAPGVDRGHRLDRGRAAAGRLRGERLRPDRDQRRAAAA